MPEYLAPGVYIEETSFRSKSIEGVSTSTAGFVGPALFGPINGDPELLTSFTDFERIYGGLDDLPHFSPDRDGDDPPRSVGRLRELLRTADGVLIGTPEYAFGVPGALKNALDWTVSSGEFDGKPVAAISASPLYTGGAKAHASLLCEGIHAVEPVFYARK